MPASNSRPADLEAQVADLARAVEELRAGVISADGQGNVILPPGANLTVRAPDGTILATFGDLVGAITAEEDGGVARGEEQGLAIRRQNGNLALTVASADGLGAGPQLVALYGNEGAYLFDDPFGGAGFGRPYFPVALPNTLWEGMPRVAVTAWTDVGAAVFYKQNPQALVTAWSSTSASDTLGEFRVLVDDAPVGDPVGISFGQAFRGTPLLPIPGAGWSTHSVRVQARRTAGTGDVRLAPTFLGVAGQ